MDFVIGSLIQLKVIDFEYKNCVYEILYIIYNIIRMGRVYGGKGKKIYYFSFVFWFFFFQIKLILYEE